MTDEFQNIACKIKTLNIFSRHDLLIVYCALGSIYLQSFYLGLIITAVPFIEFFLVYVNPNKLPTNLESKIKEQFPSANNVIFRNSGSRVTQAYSIPFLKMVVISQDDINAHLSQKDHDIDHVSAIIAHELGHLGQYDRLILRWLQPIIILYSMLSVYAFAIFVVQPLLQSWRYIYSPDFVRTIIVLISLLFILYSLFHRIAHRREYIADLQASKKSNQYLIGFLRRNKITETRKKKTTIPFIPKEGITHPSFCNRLKMIADGVSSNVLHARQIAFQWFILYFLFDVYGGGKYYNPFYYTSSLLFLCMLLWTLISLHSSGLPTRTRNRIIYEYSIGLVIGFLVSALYILFLKYIFTIYQWESAAETQRFDFLVFPILAFFVVSAYAAFFLFSILNRRIKFKPLLYSISTSFVVLLSLIVYSYEGTFSDLGKLFANKQNSIEFLSFSSCSNEPISLDQENISCLREKRRRFEYQLENLRELAIKDMKENWDFDLYGFSLIEPKLPYENKSPPKTYPIYERRIGNIKTEIGNWEKSTGRNFLTSHPSMKEVDIPAESLTIQELPSEKNIVYRNYPYDENEVSLTYITDVFFNIIWSKANGICWYKKADMYRPANIYCGQAYRQWISDLYKAEENLGEYAPYYYIGMLEHNLINTMYGEKYDTLVENYENAMQEYRSKLESLDNVIEEQMDKDRQRIFSELSEIDLIIETKSTE